MKVGIVTITRGENYGNRLQNYALYKVLKKYNIEVNTLNNYCGESKLKKTIKNLLKRTVFRFKYLSKIEREKKFEKFNKKFIEFSKFDVDNNEPSKKMISEYDFFIAGSDQIWNPNYPENSKLNFLSFFPRKKSITYAPSFGASYIPTNRQEEIKKWLLDIKSLSIREEIGKELIRDLTGRDDVDVLIDPTMLLSAEEWDIVSRKPKMLKSDRYILCYFLGDLSEQRKKQINKIAEENDCEIINILDRNSSFFQTGPSEFVWLEKHAFLICTDSFHSSVFAILYNRPFIVFGREDSTVSMNSRIETLISKFKLKDREYNGINITEENLKHDYTDAYKILEVERKKSELFLKRALDIEKVMEDGNE